MIANLRATVQVNPTSLVKVVDHESATGKRYAWVEFEGLVVYLPMDDDAALISAAGSLIAAFTSIRNAAQARLAEGWADLLSDTPFAVPESELRALAGDR